LLFLNPKQPDKIWIFLVSNLLTLRIARAYRDGMDVYKRQILALLVRGEWVSLLLLRDRVFAVPSDPDPRRTLKPIRP